jgi:MFS family permease
MNRLGDRFNKYRLASLGTLIVELSAVISLVTYYTERYWLCFICSALWGISETFFQSNTGALISLEYKGKLEGKLYYYSAYSVFRIFFAIGVTKTSHHRTHGGSVLRHMFRAAQKYRRVLDRETQA